MQLSSFYGGGRPQVPIRLLYIHKHIAKFACPLTQISDLLCLPFMSVFEHFSLNVGINFPSVIHNTKYIHPWHSKVYSPERYKKYHSKQCMWLSSNNKEGKCQAKIDDKCTLYFTLMHIIMNKHYFLSFSRLKLVRMEIAVYLKFQCIV